MLLLYTKLFRISLVFIFKWNILRGDSYGNARKALGLFHKLFISIMQHQLSKLCLCYIINIILYIET